MFVFCCCASLLLLTTAAFIIPPLCLSRSALQVTNGKQKLYGFFFILALGFFSICLYKKLGAIEQLELYKHDKEIVLQQSYQLIRPLYTRLQRELVKDRLEMPLELENIELILHFAQIHSQAHDGILQPQIQRLLLAVLKAIPEQVTALNLLAINAYKTENYPDAIKYWQSILAQFSPQMRNTDVENILQNKIAETRIKLVRQHSQHIK